MELTPEEKQKIYEEEKARLEAQEQVKKEREKRKANRRGLGCLGVILGALVLIVIGLLSEDPQSPETTATVASPKPLAAQRQVSGDYLKGGYAACVSEELFDQIISALVRKDDRGYQYLLGHGCIVTKAGIPVSVLDRTWTGTIKIRAYVNNKSVVLWTNTENVVRNK